MHPFRISDPAARISPVQAEHPSSSNDDASDSKFVSRVTGSIREVVHRARLVVLNPKALERWSDAEVPRST
jgi:hypothetical protein